MVMLANGAAKVVCELGMSAQTLYSQPLTGSTGLPRGYLLLA